METWIRKACRQRAYRQLGAWFLGGCCLVVGIAAMHDYWVNFFEGPYAISESNAATLSSLNDTRPFVTVTGSQVVDSGVREYTTETRNGAKERQYVSSAYSVLFVGNAGLLVKGNAPLSATGELKPLPTNISTLIFPDEKDAALRGRLYPVMLDTSEEYRVGGYAVIAVVLFYGLLLWFFARKAFGYVKDISTHPVVMRVESWSDAAEVAALSDLERRTPRFKHSGILVTDTFVIVRGFFTFNLLAWNHLLWAYRKATTRMINFIPVARTSEAILHFYGGSASFPARKKVVEELLVFAHQQAPWAVLGYTSDLARLWRKQQTDFLSAVDARRREYLTPTPPS